MTRNPWATLTAAISPPEWQGPTTVHRMPDDEEPKREAVEKREAVDPSLIARRQIAAHVEAGSDGVKERVTPAHTCANAGTSAGACKTHCGDKVRCWGTEP